jgi:ribosomal protein L32
MIETCTNCGMLHIRNKECNYCHLFSRREQWTF